MSAPYTLHFTEWQCGHHCQRPDDIPVADPAQATLILQAISHAISQPGHARAVLLDTDSAQFAYITDDHVSVGHGDERKFTSDGSGWTLRPVVVCCTPEQQAAIHSDELKDARECWPELIEKWDGNGALWGAEFVTTTLTVAEVQAMAAPLEAYEERTTRFEVPPVFRSADEVLAELRSEAAELEGGAA